MRCEMLNAKRKKCVKLKISFGQKFNKVFQVNELNFLVCLDGSFSTDYCKFRFEHEFPFNEHPEPDHNARFQNNYTNERAKCGSMK